MAREELCTGVCLGGRLAAAVRLRRGVFTLVCGCAVSRALVSRYDRIDNHREFLSIMGIPMRDCGARKRRRILHSDSTQFRRAGLRSMEACKDQQTFFECHFLTFYNTSGPALSHDILRTSYSRAKCNANHPSERLSRDRKINDRAKIGRVTQHPSHQA